MCLVQTKFTYVLNRPINSMFNLPCFLLAVDLWVVFIFLQYTTIDHEITLKILEFILNSIEKVKPVFLF